MVSLLASIGCQPASLGSPKPISVRTLAEEYERSTAAVRRKYDGKEIIVTGYTKTAATMPQADADQGSILLRKGETTEWDKSRAGLAWIRPRNSRSSRAANA